MEFKTYTIKIKSKEALIEAAKSNPDVMCEEHDLKRLAGRIYHNMFSRDETDKDDQLDPIWPGSYKNDNFGLFLKEEIEWVKETESVDTPSESV